jgi:hypothetical protein
MFTTVEDRDAVKCVDCRFEITGIVEIEAAKLGLTRADLMNHICPIPPVIGD